MSFEWDDGKNESNRLKHGLSFEEASQLLSGSAEVLEIYDELHSDDEERYIGIGPIDRGVIVVCYTERQENVTRIFSARMATSPERRLYAAYRGK